MFFIKYGIATSPIDVGEYLVKCPSCESDQWADVMILSNYAYVFVIPIFPVGKEANIFCKKCGLRRSGASFDSKLISEYEEVKKFYRHPWFAYIGAAVIAFPFIVGVIFAIFS
ncbi:MAG: hypothetical protein ABJB11_11390 [Ferruginibacter sp.]